MIIICLHICQAFQKPDMNHLEANSWAVLFPLPESSGLEWLKDPGQQFLRILYSSATYSHSEFLV